MVYRVALLTCTQCNGRKRVRVRVDGDITSYPACPDCGWVSWAEDPPSVDPVEEAMVREMQRQHDANGALVSDLNEFLAEWGQRQADYLGKQFEAWLAERNARNEAEQSDVNQGTSAMFREIWGILDHPE